MSIMRNVVTQENKSVSPKTTLRLGRNADGQDRTEMLSSQTRRAGFPNQNQYIRALVERVSVLTKERDFDVRLLQYNATDLIPKESK